jgi:hypothetical protein
MNTYTLYVKTHRKTGLKYLGPKYFSMHTKKCITKPMSFS